MQFNKIDSFMLFFISLNWNFFKKLVFYLFKRNLAKYLYFFIVRISRSLSQQLVFYLIKLSEEIGLRYNLDNIIRLGVEISQESCDFDTNMIQFIVWINDFDNELLSFAMHIKDDE